MPRIPKVDVRTYLISTNACLDEKYSPYCLRCTGLVRMDKVEEFYWKCRCGAECDIRDTAFENELALTYDKESARYKPTMQKDEMMLNLLWLMKDTRHRLTKDDRYSQEEIDDLLKALGDFEITLCTIGGPDDPNS